MLTPQNLTVIHPQVAVFLDSTPESELFERFPCSGSESLFAAPIDDEEEEDEDDPEEEEDDVEEEEEEENEDDYEEDEDEDDEDDDDIIIEDDEDEEPEDDDDEEEEEDDFDEGDPDSVKNFMVSSLPLLRHSPAPRRR
jgi:hypothetical protein